MKRVKPEQEGVNARLCLRHLMATQDVPGKGNRGSGNSFLEPASCSGPRCPRSTGATSGQQTEAQRAPDWCQTGCTWRLSGQCYSWQEESFPGEGYCCSHAEQNVCNLLNLCLAGTTPRYQDWTLIWSWTSKFQQSSLVAVRFFSCLPYFVAFLYLNRKELKRAAPLLSTAVQLFENHRITEVGKYLRSLSPGCDQPLSPGPEHWVPHPISPWSCSAGTTLDPLDLMALAHAPSLARALSRSHSHPTPIAPISWG